MYNCPQCGSKHSKQLRGCATRYDYSTDKAGDVRGEFRYKARHCDGCKADYYVRQLKMPGTDWGWDTYCTVGEYTLGDTSLGPVFVGSTASEYTKRISQGIQVDEIAYRRNVV